MDGKTAIASIRPMIARVERVAARNAGPVFTIGFVIGTCVRGGGTRDITISGPA